MPSIPTLNPIGTPSSVSLSPGVGSSMFPSSVPNTYQFSPVDMGSGLSGLSSLAGLAGPIGGIVGAGLNLLGSHLENERQESFYNQYMSPQAQMRQMIDAGINPNTAAAGVAGHGPAQLNAAPMSQMGSAAAQGAEAASGAVNSATQSRLADAQVQAAEAQARSLQMDTALKEVEYGFKPDVESAKLDLTRNQNRQVIQQMKESTELIKKYRSEIDKLGSEKDQIISEIGQNEYENRELSARKNLENANAALARQAEKLNDQDLKNRYNAAVSKGDYDEAAKILQDAYDFENNSARASFDANPINKDFNTQYTAMKTLDAQKQQAIEAQKQLSVEFAAGRTDLTDDQYYFMDRELSQLIRDCDNQMKISEHAFNKRAYQTGYHTEWQDKSSQLIDAGGRIISSVAGALIIKAGAKATASQLKASYDKGYTSAQSTYTAY